MVMPSSATASRPLASSRLRNSGSAQALATTRAPLRAHASSPMSRSCSTLSAGFIPRSSSTAWTASTRCCKVASFSGMGCASFDTTDSTPRAPRGVLNGIARLAQSPEHLLEVGGRLALERNARAGARMGKGEDARVQHRPPSLDRLALVVADVDALSDKRMAQLGEVDADLVLPPGLEAALDEGGAAKLLERRHVGDGTPCIGRRLSARPAEVAERAAQPIAAIEDQLRLDTLRLHRTMGDRPIGALDRVLLELGREMAMGDRRAREDHDAAGIAVEAMDHQNRRPSRVRPRFSAQQGTEVVAERVLVAGLVGHAQHPGGLVDHDHVAVGEYDRLAGERPGPQLWAMFVDGHHRTGRDARRRIG